MNTENKFVRDPERMKNRVHIRISPSDQPVRTNVSVDEKSVTRKRALDMFEERRIARELAEDCGGVLDD